MYRWSKKLEWKTLRWGTNENKLVQFNIFYPDFNEHIKKKMYNDEIRSLAQLKQEILSYCRTYWSRVEYELVVAPLIAREDEEEKIDVFYQVEMNINRITDYVNKELNLELE